MRSVYVISTNRGVTKIGMSRRPSERMESAPTGSQPKVFWASEPREDAALIEGEAHRRLLDRRESGEWFAVPAEEAVEVVRATIARVDAGETLERFKLPLHEVTDSDNRWTDDGDVHEGDAGWVADVLRNVCDKAGGTREWAYHNRMSRQYVSSVMCGRRKPSKRMLAILGIEEVSEQEITYRPIGADENEARWEFYRDGVLGPCDESVIREFTESFGRYMSDERGIANGVFRQMWAEIDRLRARS